MNDAKALVEKMFDAFRRGDIEFVIASFSDDCIISETESPDIPYRGVFRRREGARNFFGAMLSALEPGRLEADLWVCEGEHVVAMGGWGGKARATGRAWSSNISLYFRVRGGKVVEFRGHDDTAMVAAALRQA